MKKIRLSRIYYLNWKGIVLSADKPSVDATEENLEKLKEFIKTGKLVIMDPDEDKKEQETNAPHIEKAIINLPELENKTISTTVERIELYTKDQLASMSRAEVIEIATKNNLEFKKNISTPKLIDLVIENQ